MPVGCKCRFKDNLQKSNAINRLLRTSGDKIPPDEILNAVSLEKLDKWELTCNCKKPNKVISGVRYEQNDWYLRTLKNFATDKYYQNKGLGGTVVKRAIDKAMQDKVNVLAADITVTNKRSRHIFEKEGFVPVSTFCWKKGGPPVDIFHFVLYPPKNGTCQ